MGTPYSAVLTLMVTAGVINIIMGIYVVSNRSKQAMAKTFIALCFLSAVYIFGSALELSAGTLAEVKFWIAVEYFGMPFLPPVSLMLIMHFLGMDRFLKKRMRLLMYLMPLITLVLVITNDLHHFYYRSIELHTSAAIHKVELNAGPWYIIQGGYTFGCMIGGVALLLLYWNRMRSSYRLQHITMLIGLLLPIIGDFLYLGNMTPAGMDPIPVIMAVTAALYMWGLVSKGMLNVAPVARDTLFESMSDAVLVLDRNNRLVDFNPAAAAVLPELTSFTLGQPIEPLLKLHTDLSMLDFNAEADEDEPRIYDEIKWTVGEQSYYYQIRSSFIRKKNGPETSKLIVMIDVTERVRLQEQLRVMAYHDGLTGIFNRIHFIQLSEALLHQSAMQDEPLALMLFDIDHFKQINDAFGHDVGDRALLHVVEACRQLLRPEDVFGRYGGEEFVVAMPGITREEAEAAAHRIRSEIAAQSMVAAASERPLSVTASFGVAMAGAGCKKEGGGINKLLKAADNALYEAKNSGRNTVRLADMETTKQALLP
ncbi:PAS domain S-box-containing protein/diguanylate cyclase (GGDEF) domain-containing protein [Paenibacillus catalpae]|uniref:PAS domain S-box-containing protein/diguanylate cyclase (GGDEF) domain-containing protein n=1 Tax=Paenibacillus catalpae TaxID=1045775 RepID=A0A1I2GSQ4_9BACL|nr:histidine kinase N-terminal 7TM domain-containing protein [Paenibacillus catalpae]SFF19867.1 PAS domain S-box-containing protein/diguanylate cyclase (GGDEF) domain-containing protein [Paenibacillus catalpae]